VGKPTSQSLFFLFKLTPLAKQELTEYNEYRYWNIQIDGCAWDHTVRITSPIGVLLHQ